MRPDRHLLPAFQLATAFRCDYDGRLMRITKTSFILAAACLGFASAALAAGPYSYTGHGGGYDWLPINYPNVGANQTQHVSVELFTGTGASDPDIHWVVGLRGHVDTFPTRGRGVTLGHVPGCSGVMIENFYLGAAGLVSGTCQPFVFQPNRYYRIEVSAGQNNVSYTLYDRFFDLETRTYYWEPVAWDGCTSQDSSNCAQDPAIPVGGDVFVAQAFGDPGIVWSASNIVISHN